MIPMRTFRVALTLVGASLLAVPAHAVPPVYSDVSGYSISPTATGTTYYLATEKGLQSDQFQLREFSNHVERALSSKGLVRVASPDQAQTVVFLGFGIGDPKQRVASYSLPTFGQTGVSSSSTFGTVSSMGTVSATTSYTPTYGITGSSSHSYSYDTYDRWLRLTAVDGTQLRTSGTLHDLWKTEVKSTGTSGDLRVILPLMAFAASKYIGTDTGKAVRVKTKEKAKDYLQFLQQPVSGILAPTP